MQELLIFPYSGTAIEALDCLGNEWKCVGFISDDPKVIGEIKNGVEVFGRGIIGEHINAKILAVHGSPSSFLQREDILRSLNIENEKFATIIHAAAAISKNAIIGKNVLIMAGVVITANAIIGDHVVILPNSVIHHDSSINRFTLIGANCTIAGNVQIGSNCYIGAASSIKNGISIGEKVLVGMGSNVLSHINSESIVVGNPARALKE